MTKKERTHIVLTELKKMFPKATIMLRYSTPWELLVAVILSAQCTDKMVNKVTGKLFKKYVTLDNYVNAHIFEFEKDIHSTGFYRMKAKHILKTAYIIKTKYNGKVPNTMKELIQLPGVGRKTANVVLGNAFGVIEGIAVDTHVRRLARVFGLTQHTDPDKIEEDLMKLIPQDEWLVFTYRMIEYGRTYCIGRKHEHLQCPLTHLLK